MRSEENRSAKRGAEGGPHADEEDRPILGGQIAKLLYLGAQGGVAPVGSNQIAKATRLFPTLDFEYLSAAGRKQLFRRFDARDPAYLRLTHLSHSVLDPIEVVAHSLFNAMYQNGPLFASLPSERPFCFMA